MNGEDEVEMYKLRWNPGNLKKETFETRTRKIKLE